MSEKDIVKIMDVWKSGNKVLIPNTKELFLEITNQVASLFSIGPFYYYVLNFENLSMDIVHQGTREVLGLEPNQFSLQKGFDIMHPDDLAKLYEKEATATDFLLNRIPFEDILLYKVVYMMRLKHTDGHYKTILHQAKALNVSDDGKIQHVLGIHTDVSILNIPFNHEVSFISNVRPSYHCVKTGENFNFIVTDFKNLFTHREIEIIVKLSEGENFKEIAKDFFVSPHTINTHKKNILVKSGCKNTPELVAKCIREGVI
ncbi:MAG: LuxR C-terminal-related transcriptional regulator [Lutibacter sp.]|nr:LuxR C-terminal-related transcriptional regulator [Lutibacter sp.]